MRFSAKVFSESGMVLYLTIASELTIAISNPACMQWYMNTELNTSRPAGGKPNETFDIPSIVLQFGNVSLMALTPSIVSAAEPL